MQLILQRSQREAMLGRSVIFCLDARVELNSSEADSVKRYKLGNEIVYSNEKHDKMIAALNAPMSYGASHAGGIAMGAAKMMLSPYRAIAASALSHQPPRVINWPEQHYENGIAKNKSTRMRFKAMVRVLKSLRTEMLEAKIATAEPAIDFLIECLVWNVPNDRFGSVRYYDDVRAILFYLYQNSQADDQCSEWGEVSELKYLFRGPQKWTRTQAHNFVLATWQYVGFS